MAIINGVNSDSEYIECIFVSQISNPPEFFAKVIECPTATKFDQFPHYARKMILKDRPDRVTKDQ